MQTIAGGSDERTDAGHGRKLSAHWMSIEDRFALLVDDRDSVFEFTELIAQSLEGLLHHRRECFKVGVEVIAQPTEKTGHTLGADDVVLEEQSANLADQ